MILLTIFIVAVLCLILGLAEVAGFLIWVGLVGLAVAAIFALAGWGWESGRRRR